MNDSDDLSFSAADFSGRVRLFPLPNLVLFPHVMQPLHVFEPRYREMTAEALASDRLIAMSLLEAGWEHDYEGRPPIASVACLGKIATYTQQPDGRYNVLLLGLKRVRVVRELPPIHAFREAEVELFDDQYPAAQAGRRARLQRELIESFRRRLPALPVVGEQLEELFQGETPLGMLTDIVAYTLDLELRVKQQLLNERSVDRRAEMLLDQLQNLSTHLVEFPPKFSPN